MFGVVATPLLDWLHTIYGGALQEGVWLTQFLVVE